MSMEQTNDLRPTRVRWLVFAVAFLTSAVLYLHRYTFSFIKPKLNAEWGLDGTQLGAIDSAFSICYTAFQFPLAVAADALGVRAVLTALIVCWSGGMAVLAWAPTAGALWVAQALIGTGQSAVYACLSRMARNWFPPSIRTTLQGLVGILAGRLGALATSLVLATFLLGYLEVPWRSAVGILAGSGFLLAAVVAVSIRNSPAVDPRVNPAEEELIDPTAAPAASTLSQLPLTMGGMLRQMSPRSLANLLALSTQSVFSTFADAVYSSWIPLYLFQTHQLDFKKMGIYSALPLLGGAFAGLLGGAANDFLIARTGSRRWSRVTVAVAGKTIAAVLLLVALRYDANPQTFCLFLFFIKLFGDCSLTTAWGVVTDIGGRATASVFAFNNTIAGAGLIVSPVVFGYLADRYGWPAVFQSVAAAYVLCAVSWFFINCTIPVMDESQNSAPPQDEEKTV